MSRIEKLTPEQVARFPEYVEKWTRIGLSTEPTNKLRAVPYFNAAYKMGGLKPPKEVLWLKSPMGIVLLYSVWASVRDSVGASVRASVRASVWASVWASVRDSVWASVRDSVGASVRASVRASVWASVRASVGDSVEASVWASVEASVGDSVEASVRDSVEASVRDSVEASVRDSVRDSKKLKNPAWCFGQHDASWLAFYDFFRIECHLTECEKLQPLNEIAIDANWWSPFRNIVLASEKPIALRCDAQGRLHSFDSLAIEYGDGWGVYAVHGRRCPERVIKTPADRIPIEWWADEGNVETRLAVEQKIGTARILKELNAQTIHEKTLEIPGPQGKPFQHRYSVVEMAFNNGDRRKALEMTNPSTGEIHREWVPPECDKVEKALAFRNGTEALPEVLT